MTRIIRSRLSAIALLLLIPVGLVGCMEAMIALKAVGCGVLCNLGCTGEFFPDLTSIIECTVGCAAFCVLFGGITPSQECSQDVQSLASLLECEQTVILEY